MFLRISVSIISLFTLMSSVIADEVTLFQGVVYKSDASQRCISGFAFSGVNIDSGERIEVCAGVATDVTFGPKLKYFISQDNQDKNSSTLFKLSRAGTLYATGDLNSGTFVIQSVEAVLE